MHPYRYCRVDFNQLDDDRSHSQQWGVTAYAECSKSGSTVSDGQRQQNGLGNDNTSGCFRPRKRL